MNQKLTEAGASRAGKPRPFRKAVFKGLAILAPPLLTLVLFLWAWNTIEGYILKPLEATAQHLIFISINDIRNEPPGRMIEGPPEPLGHTQFIEREGQVWVQVRNKFIPREVFQFVEDHPGDSAPSTATAYYNRFIELRYLRRTVVIPVFLLLFVLVLYLIGKFIAAGVGRIIWNSIERLISRVPIISNVYSSVKQVTDFAFNDSEIQFTRIVAVQYPRKGVWSMGFVTGEGMLDIRNAANEPVVSVLMPTSPMPATGFTIMVPKSETIDLNISMDQAIQFCVSCGVVIPHQQQWRDLEAQGRKPHGLESSEAVREAIQQQISGLTDSSSEPSDPPPESDSRDDSTSRNDS